MAKEIDVETDDDFQRRDWHAERIMWFLLLVFVLAGLAGVFGRGGISTSKAGSAEQNIEVKYQRFLRYHTKDRIDITLYNLPAGENTFSLEIDKAYADKIQVEDIQPEPEKSVNTENGIQYIFHNNGAGHAKVIFYLHPDKTGKASTQIRLNNSAPVQISQYVYP